MAGQLHWQVSGERLDLSGELDRDTLLPLWQQRATLMAQVATIDVAALERVDSAGLALLVHLRDSALKRGVTPRFSGVTDKLRSLIALYNLQKIIHSDD